MASSRRNPSPSPSISSIISDVSSDVTSEELDVRNFVKKRLIKRLFLGHYQERRYVEFLSVYRDMVVLHKSETELQVDFDRVQSKLISFYGAGKWLGITSPDVIGAPAAGHCLWTKLQDVAFGFYWFQIRQIRFEDREVVVRLKVLRPVCEEVVTPSISSTSFTKSLVDNVDTLKTRIRTSVHSLTESQSSSQTPQVPTSSSHEVKETDKKPVKPTPDSEDREKTSSFPDSTTDDQNRKVEPEPLKIQDAWVLLSLMFYHWKEILTFFSVAVVGTLNGLGKCVEYVGNFSLKFIHEVTLLLRTVTPIILSVIELVGKIIGGLYLLLAMIFQRGNAPPVPSRQFMPAVQNIRPPRAIQYRSYQTGESPRRFVVE